MDDLGVLNDLVGGLGAEIQSLMDLYAEGSLALQEWRSAMEALLARYHTAAFMAGTGRQIIDAAERRLLDLYVAHQLDFLDRFAGEMGESDEFLPKWASRAQLYAKAIKGSYWSGATEILPLPAHPGDGSTQCVTNCRCAWRIEWLDRDAGDADCYWELSPVEHCQTCLVRARDWNPYRIRGWEAQGIAVEEAFEGEEPTVTVAMGKKEARPQIVAVLKIGGAQFTLERPATWCGADAATVSALQVLARQEPGEYVPDFERWVAARAQQASGGELVFLAGAPSSPDQIGIVW